MPKIKKNVRNPESRLFKALTRLFSGPITNYQQQNPRQLRRRQLDKYAKEFQSAGGLSFKKSAYSPFDGLRSNQMLNQNRAERYGDFDQMEYTPEIASSLDIYADEMTTTTLLEPLLRIDCPNEEIKSILNILYYSVLNIEFNLYGWCRTMCKYGDFFLYLDIDEENGIQNVMGLPPQEIERLEGEDENNPNYIQFQWNSGGLTFENWQMAQFRILGNDKYAPYGTSVLDPARRIWRQLTLLEDAMMAYRVVRSPDRRVFYIDVGNIAPQDVEQYIQKVVTTMKRNQVVDPTTGRVDLRYNPMSVEEDYFLPVRGTTNTRIESLAGGTMNNDIEDVKYLRDKLFSALKVPASYLSRAEGAEEDKTTLAQKDIRFARTIQRLQRAIISELEKIGIIHLYTLGYRDNDLINFKLRLNNPSKIAELQELEHWKARFDAASSATEGFFSRRWVAQHLFSMSDEEFLRNQQEIFYDRKYDAQLEATAEGVAAEAAAGDLGGALMDEEEMGAEEFAAEEEMAAEEDFGMEEEAAEEDFGIEEEGEEDTLLAAPGRRSSEMWIRADKTATGGRNYIPKNGKNDKRKSAGRAKHFKNLATGEYGNTKRTKFPGLVGPGTLGPLSRGITEGTTIYNPEELGLPLGDVQEEKKLIDSEMKIKNLIKLLETKENEKKKQKA